MNHISLKKAGLNPMQLDEFVSLGRCGSLTVHVHETAVNVPLPWSKAVVADAV